MIEFRSYQLGDRLLYEEAIYEVVKSAFTRWGSPTYQIRELGTESSTRWLTPPRGKSSKLQVVDRTAIREFVETFYRKVDLDPELGPIFHRRIHGEWGPHLDTMVRFWSAVLLREPGYQGQPPVAHRAIEELTPAHFGRWLALFRETMHEIFQPSVAEQLALRATGIAKMLSTAVFGRPWDAA
ncbi:MAG: group III truncated hemoglobin [Myxococcales bacterium]|jgi:hemoglobin|nr:group III truncated hemoglobin [Myxococcales bacterium]